MDDGSNAAPAMTAQLIEQLVIDDICFVSELSGLKPAPIAAVRDLFIKLLGSQATDAIRTISFDTDYLHHLEARVSPAAVRQALCTILYRGDSRVNITTGERIQFFSRLCNLALCASAPGLLEKLHASGPLPAGYSIFSLASDLWTHNACNHREDAFWLAAFVMYPQLKQAPQAARPAADFPLHTSWHSGSKQNLRKTLQHLLQAEDAHTLRRKLIEQLPIDVMRQDFVKDRVLPYQELIRSAAYDFHRTTGTLLRGAKLDRPTPQALEAVLNSRQFCQFAHHLIEALDWYVAADDEPTAHSIMRSIALQALIDSFHPAQQRIADCILGYHLFEPANAGQSFREIRFDLLEHVQRALDCPLADAQIISELMLHSLAPELLLDDAPDDFRYEPGPRWVELRQAIALWNNRAGKPDFKTLEALPQKLAAAATTAQEHAGVVLARTQAVLIWAVHEQVIVSRQQYSERDIYKATRAFDLLCAQLLLKLLPNRVYAAQQQLMSYGIDPAADTPGRLSGNIYTELERYVDEGADYSHDKLGKRRLPDPTLTFHDDFDRYLTEAEQLLGDLSGLFIDDLTTPHRERLLEGTLSFYAPRWPHYIGSDESHPPRAEDWEERRADRGVIVLVKHNNQHMLYELFPLDNQFTHLAITDPTAQASASPLFAHLLIRDLALDYARYNEPPVLQNAWPKIDYLKPGSGASNRERLVDCLIHQVFLFRKGPLRERCMGLTVAESRARRRAAAPFEALWKDTKNIIPLIGCLDVRSGEDAASCLLDVIPELGKPLSAAARMIKTTIKTTKTVHRGIQLAPSVYSRITSALFRQSLAQSSALAKKIATFRPGAGIGQGYRQLSGYDLHIWQPAGAMDRLAEVDGLGNVPIRNIGTLAAPDYRRLDLPTGKPYGPAIIEVASVAQPGGPSRYLSMQEHLVPGSYPGCVRIRHNAEGYTLSVAQGCDVRTFHVEPGVFDVSVDGFIYRIDTADQRPLARRLDLDDHPFRSRDLQELPIRCRPKRDLFQTCSAPVRLEVQINRFETAYPLAHQQQAALAYQTQAFQPAELMPTSLLANPPAPVNVLVLEGKFQTWADHVIPAKGRQPAQVSGKKLRPLSTDEKAAVGLAGQPLYRSEIIGRLSTRRDFGLPANLPEWKSTWINQQLPVYEVGGIAEGLDDQRTLRGIAMHGENGTEVIVEPDRNIFYRGHPMPDNSIRFSRVTDDEEIRRCLAPSEHLRFLASRPDAFRDMENLSELLYDMQPARFIHDVDASYQRYLEQYRPDSTFMNAPEPEFEAVLVLSAAQEQQRYVETAKRLIPDFKRLGDSTPARRAHVSAILDRLLPLRGKSADWTALTSEALVQAGAGQAILKHLNGANLAFAYIERSDGRRWVIYALSGGKRTKNLHLKIAEARSRVGEITYIDARAMMASRAPDPRFTSLPVLRSDTRLTVTDHDRALDAERLVATAMGDELQHSSASHIHFFSLMDTCQSCGGFVLPRLKLDYPHASFSVSYMLDYAKP